MVHANTNLKSVEIICTLRCQCDYTKKSQFLQTGNVSANSKRMEKTDFFLAVCNQHKTMLQQSSAKVYNRRIDDDIYSVRRRPRTALVRANVERHTKLLQTETPRMIKHEDCCGYCERYCEGKITPDRHREIEAWTKRVNLSMQERHQSTAVQRGPCRYLTYYRPPGTAAGGKGFRLVPTPDVLQKKQLDFSAHSLLLIKQAVAAVRIYPYASQERMNVHRDSFKFECCYEDVANAVVGRKKTSMRSTEHHKSIDINSAKDNGSVTESLPSKEGEGSSCASDSSNRAMLGRSDMTSCFAIKTDRAVCGDSTPPTSYGVQQEYYGGNTEDANRTGWCLVGHGYTTTAPSSDRTTCMNKDKSYQRPVKQSTLITSLSGSQRPTRIAELPGEQQENGDKVGCYSNTPPGVNGQQMYACCVETKASGEVVGTETKLNVSQRTNCARPVGIRDFGQDESRYPTNRTSNAHMTVSHRAPAYSSRMPSHNHTPTSPDGVSEKWKTNRECPTRKDNKPRRLPFATFSSFAAKPTGTTRSLSHKLFASHSARTRPSTAPPCIASTNNCITSNALNNMLTSRELLRNNTSRGMFNVGSSCQ